MALSMHDISILKTTWDEVAKLGMETVGLAVLYQLFMDEPQTQKLFRSMIPPGTEVTMENLKNNETFAAHGEAVALAIDKVVKLLDYPKELVEFLQELGTVHNLRNVEPYNFDLLGPVLLKVIKSVLGDSGTEEVIGTWKIAYGAIQGGILSTY